MVRKHVICMTLRARKTLLKQRLSIRYHLEFQFEFQAFPFILTMSTTLNNKQKHLYFFFIILGYKMNHFLPMIKIVKVNQSYRKLFVLFSSVQILFFTKKSYTHQSIILRFQFSTTKTFRA